MIRGRVAILDVRRPRRTGSEPAGRRGPVTVRGQVRPRQRRAASPATGALERYETAVAHALDVGHVVAFAYARHALICELGSLGLESGDEVILSPLTCKVVPVALSAMGVRPVYADIEAQTLNLNAEAIDGAAGPRTRAILFQRTYGSGLGLNRVADRSAALGLPLIEDCAQCMPAKAGWGANPLRGRAGIFSNNLGKPLPAGSGGVAVTEDAELAERIRSARDAYPPRGLWSAWLQHGRELAERWLVRPATYWLLFDLLRRTSGDYRSRSVAEDVESMVGAEAVQPTHRQVRAGARWMDRVHQWTEHRRACCADYADALSRHAGLGLPTHEPGQPLYYFPVLVERKGALLDLARRRRVPVVPWPISAPIYPVVRTADLAEYGYEPGSCPVAEDVARRLVGLPTDIRMTADVRRSVVRLLMDHYDAGGR